MNANRRELKIPDLRFPEFTGEWVEKRLGEISKIASGGTPNRQTPQFWHGNIPWVTTTQINFNEITSVKEFITEEGLKNSSAKLFPKGTLLIALYGQGITRGKVAVLGIDATTNQACASVHLDASNATTNFMFYDLQRKYEQIRNLSNDGGQKNLSAGLVKSIACGFPILPEQKKIALFLSAVDGRIEGLEKKGALLRDYKKGLMQKLFNQSLRFKDDQGNPFPDWVEKRVGEIAPLQRGFDLPHSKMKEGKYPVVFSNGILATHAEFKAKKPGVVTGRSGTLGKVTFVEQDYWPHNTSLWVTDFCGNFPKFIYYFYLRFKFEKFNSGSTVPTLNRNDVHIEKQMIPASYEEQQKIADCLSAVDRRIGSVEAQVSQSRAFKQGLLQQMFV